MAHEKPTKEAIRDILKDIQCPDCTYPNIDEEKEIEKAVNRIDLLIITMMRNERLKIEK